MTDWYSLQVQNKDFGWPEGELLRFFRSIELFFHKVWQMAWDHSLSGHFGLLLR